MSPSTLSALAFGLWVMYAGLQNQWIDRKVEAVRLQLSQAATTVNGNFENVTKDVVTIHTDLVNHEARLRVQNVDYNRLIAFMARRECQHRLTIKDNRYEACHDSADIASRLSSKLNDPHTGLHGACTLMPTNGVVCADAAELAWLLEAFKGTASL